MRNLGLNLMVGLAALALLLPFQNCSLYKSEDREAFENQGPSSFQVSTSAKLMQLGHPVRDNCEGWLDSTELKSVLGEDTHFTLFALNPTQLTCHISRDPVQGEPRFEYNCRRLADHTSRLDSYLDQHQAQWTESGETRVASLISQQKEFTLMDFYGLSPQHPQVIHCQISFVNHLTFEAHRQKVQQLGVELANHLSDQI